MSLKAEDLSEEVTELVRDAPPPHYSFQIRSFSLLSPNSLRTCESFDFEIGGYKWKLILHPAGDSARNVKDYISLYLVIADTSSFLPGWEVNVIYRFSIFDQIRDRYLTIGDAGGRVRRFHGLKTKWGFSKLISLQRFTNPTNGYLVDDTCEFGVEVFIYGNTKGGECLTMIDSPSSNTFSWKIKKFSQLVSETVDSENFNAGGYTWKLTAYPKGRKEEKNRSLSVFLGLADSGTNPMPLGTIVYAKYKVRLRNRMDGKSHEHEVDGYWFKNITAGWGLPEFISLDTLKDPTKGFLLNDTCVLEAEVTVHGLRKDTC